jgi:hypothetical protein
MGAESINMPSSITKVLSIYTSKCESFENNKIQKTNADGQLIYLNENGQEISASKNEPPPRRHKKNDKGEFLYESPDGKTELTEAQLKHHIQQEYHYQEYYIAKGNRRIPYEEYKSQYRTMESCPPCMTQQMASKAQVRHMCHELKKAANTAISEKSKIQKKLDNILQRFQQHLWIYDISFVEKASTKMRDHIALLDKLEKDIEALIKRLERVPQEEP